jgi:tetratricopeptide (TPR) repeat protein
VLQLEAQILYRMGRLGECIASYEKLFKQHKLDGDDVKTNIVAAYVAGGRAAEVSSLMEALKVAPRSGFELAHNAACALIEKGEYAQAEELLLLARRYVQYIEIFLCFCYSIILESFVLLGDNLPYSSWNMQTYYDLIIFCPDPDHLLLGKLRRCTPKDFISCTVIKSKELCSISAMFWIVDSDITCIKVY